MIRLYIERAEEIPFSFFLFSKWSCGGARVERIFLIFKNEIFLWSTGGVQVEENCQILVEKWVKMEENDYKLYEKNRRDGIVFKNY